MKTKIPLLILTIFILNAIWELAHYRLYIDLSGIPKYSHLLIATIADTIIIATIFAIITLKNKNTKWTNSPKPSDYAIITILSLTTASAIELINTNIGRWAYTQAMPTILSIGISPLLQLATTSIISLKIIQLINISR